MDFHALELEVEKLEVEKSEIFPPVQLLNIL